MFKNMDKRRLMELAGIELPKDMGKLKDFDKLDGKDSDAGLHGEQPTGGDESTEEHLDKETSVFSKVHDALEELLSFLQSQEGFEEKRGKEEEYSQMEHDAEDLKNAMKKHLSGYEGNEEGEDEPEAEPEMKPKMSFR
jgi:hypothetical protein